MKMMRGLTGTAFAGVLLLPFILPTTALAAGKGNNVQQVLLISIDGFHAVDLEICVAAGTCPNLASLTQTGVTYTNASTTKPSDSFPGLLAQLTGGTPKSTGIFYDDSYDRTLFAPGSNCTVGPGTEMNIAEPIDHNPHSIDGGVNASLTGLNSAVAIDPNHLPGSNAHGPCAPVWPHNLVRTNTIFGVLHARGTADRMGGQASGLRHHQRQRAHDPADQRSGHQCRRLLCTRDQFRSEPSQHQLDRLARSPLDRTRADPDFGQQDFTGTIAGVEWYDGIKVQAVLNEIDGFDHTGTRRLGTPTLFGMNFQSVSVGQKLAIGGYTDPFGTPSANLANTIAFVDTLDRPDDRSAEQAWPRQEHHGHRQRQARPVAHRSQQADAPSTMARSSPRRSAPTSPSTSPMTASLIWLKPPYSAANVAAAVAALNAFQPGDTGIVEWLAGPLLSLPFQDPATDSRTPDIIGIARVGVIYTSGSKIAEHGGFNEDDTHVALIVANAGLTALRRQRSGDDDADRADHSRSARSRSECTRRSAHGRDDRTSGPRAVGIRPFTRS